MGLPNNVVQLAFLSSMSMKHFDLALSTVHSTIVGLFHLTFLILLANGIVIEESVYAAVHGFSIIYCTIDIAIITADYSKYGQNAAKYIFHHIVLIICSFIVIFTIFGPHGMKDAVKYSGAWLAELSTPPLNLIFCMVRERRRIPPGLASAVAAWYILTRPITLFFVVYIVFRDYGLGMNFFLIFSIWALNMYWAEKLIKKMMLLRMKEVKSF